MKLMAERIEERIKALGISKGELARRLGISPSTFWRIRSGKSDMKAKDMDALVAILQTTREYLEGRTDSPDAYVSDRGILAVTTRQIDEQRAKAGLPPLHTLAPSAIPSMRTRTATEETHAITELDTCEQEVLSLLRGMSEERKVKVLHYARDQKELEELKRLLETKNKLE